MQSLLRPVVAALLATALGGAAAMAQEAPRIVVVVHGQASDPFWSVVKNGVDEAQKVTGATVEYRAPATFDMVEMAQLIDAAVASKPDGLVVSVPDAAALGDSIKNAVASGIPVVSMNSGSDVREELGVLVHVGQTEFEAGEGGGKKMKEAGVTKAICVNQEVGNVALDLRCEGFAKGLGGDVAGGRGQHGPDRDPECGQGPVRRQRRTSAACWPSGRRRPSRRSPRWRSSTSWTR